MKSIARRALIVLLAVVAVGGAVALGRISVNTLGDAELVSPTSVQEFSGRARAPLSFDPTQETSGSRIFSSSLQGADVAGPGGGAVPPTGVDSRVIRTAEIRVRVAEDSFGEKFGQVSSMADRLGGFVASSFTSETKDEVASGTITIRVPFDKFQAALKELRGLGEVAGEREDGRDVTAEFVDLEARLRHSKTQESFYLGLMGQAKTIAEMVQIQEQLSQVQLRIEEIQGQLNYLKDQTSFATITAHIFEPQAAARKGALGKAFEEAIAGFKAVVSGMIIAVGWLAPPAILVAVGTVTWRLTRRRRGEARAKESAA